MHASGSSPEKVSKGGALPLCIELGTRGAGTGKVRPDDGGVAGVVTELTGCTTRDGEEGNASPGKDGKGGEMAGGVVTGPSQSGAA